MTVKQLIQSLSKIQDQDIRVMVKGYEGGYNDIVDINPAPIDIALDVNDQWYYGKHETLDDIDPSNSTQYQIVKAIIL
jgi:hypothetical protein